MCKQYLHEVSSQQRRESNSFSSLEGPFLPPQGSVDDARGEPELLDPGQPAGSPFVGHKIVTQGRWRWEAFRILPECSVGGRRALDSDPREAPGSRLAWSQFQRVSLPWMTVSGLSSCFIVMCLFTTNSSLKDVWNLSLSILPPHFTFSCRHLSLLRIRRVQLISKSLLEIARQGCWNMEASPKSRNDSGKNKLIQLP